MLRPATCKPWIVWSRPQASWPQPRGAVCVCARVAVPLGGTLQSTAHSSVLCSVTLGARLSPLPAMGPGGPEVWHGASHCRAFPEIVFCFLMAPGSGAGGAWKPQGHRKAGEAPAATPPQSWFSCLSFKLSASSSLRMLTNDYVKTQNQLKNFSSALMRFFLNIGALYH